MTQALHVACERGHLGAVRSLLARVALEDSGARRRALLEGRGAETPLQLAARRRRLADPWRKNARLCARAECLIVPGRAQAKGDFAAVALELINAGSRPPRQKPLASER